MSSKEERWLAEQGFYIHYVPLGAGYINAHTHGVPSRYPDQLDFQLVVGVSTEAASSIFWDFYRRVEVGERFAHGQRVTEILRNGSVLLERARETGRDVLRVLLPALDGTLPGDEGHPPDFYPLQRDLDTDDPAN